MGSMGMSMFIIYSLESMLHFHFKVLVIYVINDEYQLFS